MCGIAGIVDFRARPEINPRTLRRMCALLAHRGPDDEGILVCGRAGLAHRRLSITDLVTGGQPLANEDGSVWVVFNGEITNYRALRTDLERRGHRFASRTDTEVIPHLYEELGLDFVSRLEGNWAIGLWDSKHERLVLTRDRVGKKPLVWSEHGGIVRFASEAKALFADSALTRSVDPRGLLDVLTYGYVTEEHTMFEGVSMLRPATLAVFERGRKVTERRYWDVADAPPFAGTVEEALEDFTALFSQVTGERLLGDVPYGLLLSGGIDSSLVGSFIVEHEPDLRTYTIARRDRDDETAAAALAARSLGTRHTVVELAAADPAEVAARIPWMFDQPFFNDATIANMLVSSSVSREITVAITGDGGDHAFSGTLRHLGDELARTIARAPQPLVAAGLGITGVGERLVGPCRPLRRAGLLMKASQVDPRSRWLTLHQQQLPAGFRDLLATRAWDAAGDYDPHESPLAYYDRCASPAHLNRVLYAELTFQLPPNDLMKVDRTTMYNQIAARAPFLDRRVLEFAAALPAAWKRRGRFLKWFLRELASRRLPHQLSRLPKTGLAVPLREWLRGPLGLDVARLIESSSFRRRGLFNLEGARYALAEHRAGRADYAYALWTMAMTELWFRCMVDTFGEPDRRIWD
jgi:asparagine synthase (glutamine-hydrolysing)